MTTQSQTLFEQERSKATQIYRNIKNKNDASAPKLMDRVKREKYRALNRQMKA
ncbi:MAG: hypothetical protein H0T84_03010 [Tatlockia sp.]|nr:hypothetical protein [Tatlockia sp.]